VDDTGVGAGLGGASTCVLGNKAVSGLLRAPRSCPAHSLEAALWPRPVSGAPVLRAASREGWGACRVLSQPAALPQVSTRETRETGRGWFAVQEHVRRLGAAHSQHLMAYGAGAAARLGPSALAFRAVRCPRWSLGSDSNALPPPLRGTSAGSPPSRPGTPVTLLLLQNCLKCLKCL